jgi:hypothetical protein
MPEFLPVDAGATHPDLPAAVINPSGRLATSPDHGLEMFFGAVFQRK